MKPLWSPNITINNCCSITQLCLTLCNPMHCSMPGFPVLHHLSELAQTHVHWVGDAFQPSYPLSSPSPPAFNLSQHQDLYQWVSSWYQGSILKNGSHIAGVKILFSWKISSSIIFGYYFCTLKKNSFIGKWPSQMFDALLFNLLHYFLTYYLICYFPLSS